MCVNSNSFHAENSCSILVQSYVEISLLIAYSHRVCVCVWNLLSVFYWNFNDFAKSAASACVLFPLADRSSAMTRSRGKPFFTISATSVSVNRSLGSMTSRGGDVVDDVRAADDDPAAVNAPNYIEYKHILTLPKIISHAISFICQCLPSFLLRSIALRISSSSSASAVAFISSSAAFRLSSPLSVSRLWVGNSFSGKNRVSVPVVPMRSTLCCRSIVHWCRFSMSNPRSMSIVWSSSTEKLVTKNSFSMSTWATCTRPIIFCTPTPLAMPAHLPIE